MTNGAATAFRFTRRALGLALGGGLMLSLAACGEEAAKKADKPAEPAPKTAATGTPAALLQPGPLGDKIIGKADAPVTIVEYASLTCGHCANFHNGTFKKIKEKYIDSGKVRYIFREFPLDPLSTAASMIARCAPEARYHPLIDLLFAQQQTWAFGQKPLDELLAIARQAGFTQETFEACLKNQSVYEGLNEVKKRGAEVHGVNSTPSFFINGQILRGDQPIEDFEKVIEPLLK